MAPSTYVPKDARHGTKVNCYANSITTVESLNRNQLAAYLPETRKNWKISEYLFCKK